jgi:hypothetical protein
VAANPFHLLALKASNNKKGPGNRGLEAFLILNVALTGAPKKATSSFLQAPFSSGRLSWLRSSSIWFSLTSNFAT